MEFSVHRKIGNFNVSRHIKSSAARCQESDSLTSRGSLISGSSMGHRFQSLFNVEAYFAACTILRGYRSYELRRAIRNRSLAKRSATCVLTIE